MEAATTNPGTAMESVLACPHDGTVLRAGGAALSCPTCGASYAVSDGVVLFLDEEDSFYEGAYRSHIAYVPRTDRFPYHLPLWLINSGYLWDVRRQVPAGGRVLELGCASGIAYFAERYEMFGLDVSLSSLKPLAGRYAACLMASAVERLPLADASFDAVVSSYFWEHLEAEHKRFVAGELCRVLRPGGKIVLLYDVETANPLISVFRRRDPERYRRLFLEQDGHLGYQTSAENARILEEAGLEILSRRGIEKTFVQSPSVYTKLKEWPGTAGGFFSLAEKVSRPPWFYLYTLLQRLWDSALGWALPAGWARIELSIARRPDAPEPSPR